MIVRILYRGNSLLARRERRREGRTSARRALAVKVLETGDIHWGICRDLSAGGIAFETEYVPRFGQLLEIRLVPARTGPALPLCALVRVRRCVPCAAGYRIGAAIAEMLYKHGRCSKSGIVEQRASHAVSKALLAILTCEIAGKPVPDSLVEAYAVAMERWTAAHEARLRLEQAVKAADG